MTIRPSDDKTVVMMVWNTCENDSRVIKEATTLAEAGYATTVVCLRAPHLPQTERLEGVTYLRTEEAFGRLRRRLTKLLSTARSLAQKRKPAAEPGRPGSSPSISRILTSLYRVLTLFLAYPTMRREVAALRPDVVHAHDLQTLPAAWRLAKRLKARLVYDSHELAAHVSILFPKPIRWLIEHLERRYITRADRVITVSPGIAMHLASTYGIPRPSVLYNSPPTQGPAGGGRTLRTELGLADETPIIVYVGGLAAHRGLEHVLASIALLPGFHLACVGPRRQEWEVAMTTRAATTGVADRLHFLDPVPVSHLTSFLSDADVGVVPVQDVCLSYRYSLPNKLFETVLAGLPVVVNDLPDMRDFVKSQGVGQAVECSDPAVLADSIRRTAEDPGFRPAGDRLLRLRSEFGWGAQSKQLLQIYRGLI